ncbi:MAG TPA: sensor histidine kinase [Rhizomicrobium sp.]|nr:sensor histidine kinase [Rhizomicrobium sp.]
MRLVVALLATSLVLAGLDYLLGAEISLSVFYAIPVVLMTWFVGRGWAYLQAFMMLLLLVITNYAEEIGTPPSWQTYLNDVYRLVFFVFLIEVLSRLKFLQKNLETLAESRALALAAEAARSLDLERELLEAREMEQQRIGQELHDGLCQHLTGTALASQALAENLETQALPQADTAKRLVELVEGGIRLARGIAKGLYPIETDNDGLMRALEDLTSETSDLLGVQCRFACDNPVLIDTPSTAAHLYRIAQEAVSNAVRHGQATEIEVLLEESDSGIRLAVSDNGKGMPASPPPQRGLGLRTMADRAKSIGADFYIKSAMLGGTEVGCVLCSPPA